MSLEQEPSTANEYRAACGEHCAQPGDLVRQLETLLRDNSRLRIDVTTLQGELRQRKRDNEQLQRELAELRRTQQMILCEGPIDIDRGMISED